MRHRYSGIRTRLVSSLLALALLPAAAPRPTAAPAPAPAPTGPLSGVQARQLANLKSLAEANLNADAWRALKEEDLKKKADAAYKAAVDGHEALNREIDARVAAINPAQGGERTLDAIKQEKAIRELDVNVKFQLAQMNIFWGRLYPDDNPDGDKGNAKAERGNDLLNSLRDRVTGATGIDKEKAVGTVIPPSFFFLKAMVMWQRGDRDKTLSNFQKAVQGMKESPLPEMKEALIQALYRKGEFLIEQSEKDKGQLDDAMATVEELLKASSQKEPMKKLALLMKASILLMKGSKAEAMEIAGPFTRDMGSRIRQTLARDIVKRAAEGLPLAQQPVELLDEIARGAIHEGETGADAAKRKAANTHAIEALGILKDKVQKALSEGKASEEDKKGLEKIFLQARYNIAVTQYRLGKPKEAAKAFEEFLSNYGTHESVPKAAYYAYLSWRDVSKVPSPDAETLKAYETSMRRFLDKNPGHEKTDVALFDLAELLEKKGAVDEALEVYKRLPPTSKFFLYGKYKIATVHKAKEEKLRTEKKDKEAAAAREVAREGFTAIAGGKAPRDLLEVQAFSIFQLAKMAAEDGKADEIRKWRDALRKHPTAGNQGTRDMIANTYDLEHALVLGKDKPFHLDEAEKFIVDVIEKETDPKDKENRALWNAHVRVQQACEKALGGEVDPEKADPDQKKLLERQATHELWLIEVKGADDFKSLYKKGRIYVRYKGDLKAAEEAFSKAEPKASGEEEKMNVLRQLGEIQKRQTAKNPGKWRDVAATYEKLLALKPNVVDFLRTYAEAQSQTGSHEKALGKWKTLRDMTRAALDKTRERWEAVQGQPSVDAQERKKAEDGFKTARTNFFEVVHGLASTYVRIGKPEDLEYGALLIWNHWLFFPADDLGGPEQKGKFVALLKEIDSKTPGGTTWNTASGPADAKKKLQEYLQHVEAGTRPAAPPPAPQPVPTTNGGKEPKA